MDTAGYSVYVGQLAFPDDEHLPADSLKLSYVPSVTHNVACELRMPVLLARPRQLGRTTGWIRMLVPEASMHEDHLTPSREGEIRSAREIYAVKAEPVTQSMYQSADIYFWLRVSPAYRSHRPSPCGGNVLEVTQSATIPSLEAQHRPSRTQ